jgi:uncharacterized repeat protein (TIGR01451 family)
MKLLRPIASLLLLASVPMLAHAGAQRLQRDPIAFELALKGHETRGTPASVVLDTVNYTDTTVGAPTWTRPLADCSGLSGVGVGVGHHVQEFTVSTTGAYDITSAQVGAADGFILLYVNSFNPSDQLTNCQAGNDDAAAGIGFSEILGENLTAGTSYFLVTTAFEPGEESGFTNTISGGGNVVLVGAGPDLGVTVTAPDGVLTGGQFTYELTAVNNGVGPATGVVVTDTLSPSVTFVSSSCGATNVAGTVTWNIGALAEAATATCTITVSMGPTCATVDNVAIIDGAESDGVASNNTSSTSNSAGNIVADPSFEDGSPNSFWTEASTNFGSPLCTEAGCGLGTGTGPRTGDWWTWFGGIAGAAEAGSMVQSVTIPTGATSMSFWVEFPVCSPNGTADFVRLQIDGTEVWREDATSARCNTVGYQQVTVDVSAYDDGAAHTVSFNSTTAVSAGNASNFFIDDVSLLGAPTCGVATGGPAAGPDVPVPALDRFQTVLLMILLGLVGLVAMRRQTA